VNGILLIRAEPCCRLQAGIDKEKCFSVSRHELKQTNRQQPLFLLSIISVLALLNLVQRWMAKEG
jgi:hypothetical protein